MSRKRFESIDLMKLWALGSNNGWNEYLTACVQRRDINALAKLKYQISVGMAELAKQKSNTEEINVWFARLVKSIEDTAKKIIRIKHPMKNDNPLASDPTALESKRKRDQELADFFKRSSY